MVSKLTLVAVKPSGKLSSSAHLRPVVMCVDIDMLNEYAMTDV